LNIRAFSKECYGRCNVFIQSFKGQKRHADFDQNNQRGNNNNNNNNNQQKRMRTDNYNRGGSSFGGKGKAELRILLPSKVSKFIKKQKGF
jgi:hypothetical protein